MTDKPKKSKVNPKSLANLNPWKSGQSGNLNGKPKGIKSFSSLLKEFASKKLPSDHEIIKALKEDFPHYFKGNESCDMYTVAVLQLMNGMIQEEGTVKRQYISDFIDRVEGKAVQFNANLNANINIDDLKNLSDDELRQREKAARDILLSDKD